jgi:hypothetical protein
MLNYAATRARENVIHSDLLRFQIVVVFHDSMVSSEFDPEFSCGKIPNPDQQSSSLVGWQLTYLLSPRFA